MLQEELAQHIESRKAEMESYQMNIDNYTLLLKKLPSNWPEHLLKYKGKSIEQIVITAVEGEDIEHISDLVFRDKIAISLRQEMLQHRIASQLCDVLVERHSDADVRLL